MARGRKAPKPQSQRHRRRKGLPRGDIVSAGGGGNAGPLMKLPAQMRDVHKFTRSVAVGYITATAADKGYAWSFALSDMPSASDFTGLFDQYRIMRVVQKFSYTPTAAASYYPIMHIAADYDNAVAPSTIGSLTQRTHISFTFSPSRPQVSFHLVPRTPTAVGSGLTATGLSKAKQWLNCSDSTTVHYGSVAWITGYNSTTGDAIFYEETLFLEFASPQ